MKNPGFTLAETLITIGIIGVVSAMTIPTLITKYQKSQVETRLKRFYSMINQTVRLSAAENDDADGWVTLNGEYSYNKNLEWLKQYIYPYMKHINYKQCYNGGNYNAVCTTLFDGSVMIFKIDTNGAFIKLFLDGNIENLKERNYFFFQFNSAKTVGGKISNSINFVEPTTLDWDGTSVETLKNDSKYGYRHSSDSCRFCTKIIQLNNWKIPDDYPW
ncbi:type II secretion system protein [bacterium]|nr:type II secretion system protein [bacterium]